jgi:Putative rRNA methylase
MFSKFPLFQSHLDLAQHYWRAIVLTGDIVIDATCGNGHDTLTLAQLSLNAGNGIIYAIDLQESAIENTKKILAQHYSQEDLARIKFIQGCHANFPSEISPGSVKLIVYNLGYLPGGDKGKTTISELTLSSIKKAIDLICAGGCLSITCYPGHEEGAREENMILHFTKSLNPREWSCCHHNWTNRQHSPSLFFLQKKIKN